MHKYLIVLILILSFSCTEKKTDSRIIEFENALGERKTKSLNLLVLDFEKNLIKIYPELSLERGYKQYLRDIVTASEEDGNKFIFQSDETNYEFHESGLWDEIYEMDNEYGLGPKAAGKMIEALFTLGDSDALVKKFSDNRQAAGVLPNELFVPQVLSTNPNFSDYFHKRIVVLNYSY